MICSYLFKELKYVLLENGCRGIFFEADSIEKKSSANVVEIGDDADIVDNTNAGGSHGKLPEESVQFLADRLMDFIYSKYSINKWDDVEEICKAAVIIFPSVELVRNLAQFFTSYFIILKTAKNSVFFCFEFIQGSTIQL